MKFINEKAETDWNYGKKINVDPYSHAIFVYAEAWVDLMEERLNENPEVKISTIADELSHTADTDGITGNQYGYAVRYLSIVWLHGEELRIWHNLKTQFGHEGEEANKNGTTLNPAMLTIETNK